MVDLRNRIAFAAGHVPGTLNFGLDGGFATYLGWLIPWGTPVTLLGDPEQVAEAQRELVRIGIDRPAADATGRPDDWAGGGALASPRLATSRTSPPWAPGPAGRSCSTSGATWSGTAGHIAGAVHIPLHELLRRLDELPAGEVWVHCESGLPLRPGGVHPRRRWPARGRHQRRLRQRRGRRAGRGAGVSTASWFSAGCR